ncbi:MAG: chemotaxis protein CheW [Sulfobacillus thermotolerans]|uniref:Chemotaxis protein CheA n=1 Tax=Sulfobacillus thermotolerans TaxID=338644 RepID=A0ABN5GZW3_9FIRM|nr:chemotaxis protein CheA [Sulfobacillus thermotolerans]MCY0907767.1 chemotaxis protein CheW [Sulfobacillus thermotolerans]
MRFSEIQWDSPEERDLFMQEATELLASLEEGALMASPPLDALFRAAHTLKGSGGMVGLTDWVTAAHDLEDALDKVRQGARQFDEDLQKETLHTVDVLRAELAGAAPMSSGDETVVWELTWDKNAPMLGVRAYQAWQSVSAAFPGTQSDPPEAELSGWTGTTSRLRVPKSAEASKVRALLAEIDNLVSVDVVRGPEGASEDAKAVPAVSTSAPVTGSAPREGTIRIGAASLERILEGLGELLLDQGQLEHHFGGSADQATRSVLDHMRRRALDLQDLTLRARMLPLDTLFRQYPRAIHDMAKQLDKKIRLETQGGETELDRLVMDRLHEPLLHLLRNACDHGIESGEVRVAHGKPEMGTVRLAAYAAQGHVHVRVEDDGGGIEWDRLREKAVRQGWMSAEEALHASTDRLSELLFRPGVSTAEKVTDLSGRGVGLDVVKAFLDEIHGTITVESDLHKGTAFHLELPMTMAIMTALIVDAGPWTIGLPILTVERIDVAQQAGISTVLGQTAVPDDDAPIPVYSLAQLLDPTAAHEDTYLIRVKDGRTQAALAVDEVRGQQEVVVKPVATLASVTPWLSGVALLGDGRLALMIDVRRLVPSTRTDRERVHDDGILRAGSNQMELLVFQLSDGQRYGINVYKTREVLRAAEVTRVPEQHGWLYGFLRLRGQTVPVVSLHRALGLPEPGPDAVMLMTEFNQSVQAFPVDMVDRMVRVSWDRVEPLPPVLDTAVSGRRRFTGLIDHPELGPIQLIDFEQILEQVAPPEYPPVKADIHSPITGKTVWLADDSRVALNQVEKALHPLGLQVRTFADGEALWEAVEKAESLPALFVLDVEMPRLDGYTLTQRLKHEARTHEIPILLHTSLSGHWHADRAQQVEADAIVTKFDPAMLARTVAGLLLPVSAHHESVPALS